MSLLQCEWILFLWRSVSVCPCEASFERRSYWYGNTKNVFYCLPCIWFKTNFLCCMLSPGRCTTWFALRSLCTPGVSLVFETCKLNIILAGWSSWLGFSFNFFKTLHCFFKCKAAARYLYILLSWLVYLIQAASCRKMDLHVSFYFVCIRWWCVQVC